MKKTFITTPLIFMLLWLAPSTMAKSAMSKVDEQVVWKSAFFSVIPNKSHIKHSYCVSHSPDIIETSMASLKAGAIAENGTMIKVLSYKQQQAHGLYFTEAKATLSGIYDNKPWKTDMHFYVQKLTQGGILTGIWSTSECKGRFTARAYKPNELINQPQ